MYWTAHQKLLDYLDDESREHFAQLCGLLDAVGIQYEINPKIGALV
mgnify:CR=1 FL=1